MIRLYLSGLVTLLSAIACNPAAEHTNPDPVPVAATDTTTIRSAIMAEFNASIAGWNNGDIVAYMNAFERSDSLRTVDGDRAYMGWQRGVDGWLESDPKGEQMGTAFTDEATIDVLSENSAVLFNRWRIVLDTDTMSGATTAVWQKLPEGWRIVHSHTSYGS